MGKISTMQASGKTFSKGSSPLGQFLLATENKIINQETSDGDRPNSPWTAWADGSWNSAEPPIRA
jgi:hypothetical protein